MCTLKLFKPIKNTFCCCRRTNPEQKALIGDILLISDAQMQSNTNHKVKNQNKIYITGL